VVRTFGQEDLEELAASSAIPIINALTDLWHPCQILADLLTVKQALGRLSGTRWTYLGDGNNIARTLVMAAGLMGFALKLAGPKKYWIGQDILEAARRYNPRLDVVMTEDPEQAVREAQVLYTDTWLSMGDSLEETQIRQREFRPFQLTGQLVHRASKDAVVLHCLPAHRGEEITDEVLDGPQSMVWTQAKNRLPAQRALLELIMGRKKPARRKTVPRKSRGKSS